MTKPDTTAEAVERLAEAIEEGARAFGGAADAVTRDDMVAAFRGQEVHQRNLAATLRALLAERDEAIDQRNAADFVLALSIEQSTRHSVERDAARAEAARLREAGAAVLDYLLLPEWLNKPGDSDVWAIRKSDLRTLRAALAAKEPGHD